MTLGLFIGLLLILVFLLAMIGLPVALLVSLYTGFVDVGFTSAVESPAPRKLPDSVNLVEGETPIISTVVDRSRWAPLLLVGLVFSPLAWGIPLMIYAWRLRNRPQYVFTDRRLIVERPHERESVELERITQVQSGTTTVESFLNRSHVTFSIDRRQLNTVGYLNDAGRMTEAIENALANEG